MAKDLEAKIKILADADLASSGTNAGVCVGEIAQQIQAENVLALRLGTVYVENMETGWLGQQSVFGVEGKGLPWVRGTKTRAISLAAARTGVGCPLAKSCGKGMLDF